MRLPAQLLLVALFAPCYGAAQSTDQPNVSVTFYGGFSTGQALWQVRKLPLCVWEVAVGGYQCEQAGGTTVADTLTLNRRVSLGTNVGIALTLFHDSHVGARIGLTYLNESIENRCTTAAPFQADTIGKNSQVCSSFSSTSASLSVVALSGSAELRLLARSQFSPYVRIGGGVGIQLGETLAASGTFVDQGVTTQPLERSLVRDSSSDALRPFLEFALGLTSGIGSGSRFRLELSDMLVPLQRLTGPVDASGAAPHAARFFNNFSFTLGIDLVLGSHHGRRY
jgi:opacity protein-like surface antigen